MFLAEMQRSSQRMELILNNLRDFALGRLGTGIQLVAPAPTPLEPVLHGIVEEIERLSEQAMIWTSICRGRSDAIRCGWARSYRIFWATL